MFAAALRKLRDAVREQRYVMTLHAEEEMDADDLSIFDVETRSSKATSSNDSETKSGASGST